MVNTVANNKHCDKERFEIVIIYLIVGYIIGNTLPIIIRAPNMSYYGSYTPFDVE